MRKLGFSTSFQKNKNNFLSLKGNTYLPLLVVFTIYEIMERFFKMVYFWSIYSCCFCEKINIPFSWPIFPFLSLHIPYIDILILFYLKFCCEKLKKEKRNKSCSPAVRGGRTSFLFRDSNSRTISGWVMVPWNYRG